MINVSSVKLLQQHIIIPYTRAGAVNNNITSSGNVRAFVQKEMDFEFVFTYIHVLTHKTCLKFMNWSN